MIRQLALLILVPAVALAQPRTDEDFIPPPIDPNTGKVQGPSVRRRNAPLRKRPPTKKVQPSGTAKKAPGAIPPSAQVAPAPAWTRRDSITAARLLVADLLKRRPGKLKVWVAPFRNRTTHHINTHALEAPLKKRLAAVKRVQVVDRSKGPKLVLEGLVVSQDDATTSGDQQLNALFLSLRLVDVASREALWIGGYWTRHLVERIPKAKRKKGQAPFSVKRLKAGAQLDLSGNFNDADARMAARAAAKDLLGRKWLSRSKPPVLVLYPLRNRTAEHINHRLITSIFAIPLVRSGKVRIVVKPSSWGAARAAGTASPRKATELAATHVVSGWITSVVEASARQYNVSLQMIDTDSSAKKWIFVKPIKKVVAKP